MEIEISQEQIDEGTNDSNTNCAVANALREQGINAFVQLTQVSTGPPTEQQTFRYSDAMARWMMNLVQAYQHDYDDLEGEPLTEIAGPITLVLEDGEGRIKEETTTEPLPA